MAAAPIQRDENDHKGIEILTVENGYLVYRTRGFMSDAPRSLWGPQVRVYETLDGLFEALRREFAPNA